MYNKMNNECVDNILKLPVIFLDSAEPGKQILERLRLQTRDEWKLKKTTIV